MSTIRLHATTTLTPKQYIAGLTDFGPAVQNSLATALMKISGFIISASRMPT